MIFQYYTCDPLNFFVEALFLFMGARYDFKNYQLKPHDGFRCIGKTFTRVGMKSYVSSCVRFPHSMDCISTLFQLVPRFIQLCAQ